MNKLLLLLVITTLINSGYAVEPSGTLPLLVIETNNHQVIDSKETYVNGTYYLDPQGVEGVEAIGSSENPLPLKIKGRGNFTWNSFNKKPYRLKLDKKAALLGMNSSKHFALLAHADDNRAFMRNLTGFEVSRMAGLPWTPDDKPCEVILNGDYIGLYFLTETIRFDKKRINLTNPDDVMEDWLGANPDKTAADYPYTDEDYTGAWLVELDNNQDEFQVVVPSRHFDGANILVTYKSPEDYVTDAHRRWLINEFDEIDRLVYANDNGEGAWLEKIDLTDAARFFVVNQIMNNYESYSGSCYLSKDKGEGEKWHFGPVWDFGSAFQPSRNMTQWIWESQYIQHWVKNFWNCEAFRNEVKRIFMEMDNEGFDRIFTYQNEYAERITSAARRDAERWRNDGYGNADMQTPLSEVQQQLTEAINSFGYKLGVEGYTEPETPECEIYLRGSNYNGWGVTDANKFTHKGDNIYELYMPELGGEFKIADPSWTVVDLGLPKKEKIDLEKLYSLSNQGLNIELNQGSATNVLVRVDLNNRKISVHDASGVELKLTENNIKTVYYNLQGNRVTNPKTGDIYIRKTKSGFEKIVY